jgi:hypothetical protein
MGATTFSKMYRSVSLVSASQYELKIRSQNATPARTVVCLFIDRCNLPGANSEPKGYEGFLMMALLSAAVLIAVLSFGCSSERATSYAAKAFIRC